MTKTEQDKVLEIMGIIEDVESETNSRISDYDNLRKYIDGEHWGNGFSPPLPDGNVQSTFNYMQVIVKTHVSKLLGTNSPGEVTVDCLADAPEDLALEEGLNPTEMDDETKKSYEEKAKRSAQFREDVLKKAWQNNNMSILLEELAENAVGFGDGFIMGPFWDKERETVTFENIKDPGSVMVVWSSDEYDDVDAIIIHKRYTRKRIEKMYKDEIKKRGIRISEGKPTSSNVMSDMPSATYVPMNDLYHYIDETSHIVICDKQILSWETHNYGFTPFEHFKYMQKVNRPFGKSVLWDGRNSQLDFNETLSNTLTIIKKLSGLKFKGINLPEGYEKSIKGGRVQILPLKQTQNMKQDIEVLNTSVQIWPDDKVLERVKEALLEQCFLTPMDLGGPGSTTNSGYALELRSQSSLSRAKSGRKYLELTLQRLNANILKLVEKKVPGAKELIGGNYDSRIIFPDILPKSAVELVNQVNARMISLDSAMRAIGVENPDREIQKIKSELDDTTIGPEISRNWQAHMMADQAEAMAANPAGVSQEGQETAEGGAPQRVVSDNMAGNEPLPMAMSGVQGGSAVMGGQGAINQSLNQGA